MLIQALLALYLYAGFFTAGMVTSNLIRSGVRPTAWLAPSLVFLWPAYIMDVIREAGSDKE